MSKQEHLFPVVSVKPPIFYFGGKSRAVPHLLPFIPAGVTEIVSPFIGGGSLELALTARGVRVHGYDAFPPLVAFWQELLTDPDALIPHIKRFVRQFLDGELLATDDVLAGLTTRTECGAMFVAKTGVSFNKMFRGSSIPPFLINEHGEPIHGFSSRKNARKIRFDRIRGFQNALISVGCADFKESLARHPDLFAYLDPPYPESSRGYGGSPEFHEKFPHEDLVEILRTRQNWMMSYNNCETVRALYPPSDFRYDYPKWRLSSRNRATEGCNEVIIRPM